MLVLASDHAGYPLKEEIKAYLDGKGIEYIDCGADSTASVDYAQYAQKACLKVTSGEADLGILCCGTGIGMSITANKVKGIRAAVLSDEFSAQATAEHNDTNVLALGGRIVSPEKAVKLVDIWLSTPFAGGRHQQRIDKIKAIEEND